MDTNSRSKLVRNQVEDGQIGEKKVDFDWFESRLKIGLKIDPKVDQNWWNWTEPLTANGPK